MLHVSMLHWSFSQSTLQVDTYLQNSFCLNEWRLASRKRYKFFNENPLTSDDITQHHTISNSNESSINPTNGYPGIMLLCSCSIPFITLLLESNTTSSTHENDLIPFIKNKRKALLAQYLVCTLLCVPASTAVPPLHSDHTNF